MNKKYIFTKNETIRRTERVEYIVNIPDNIKEEDKEEYARKIVEGGEFEDYKEVDISDSELLDEEFISLKEIK